MPTSANCPKNRSNFRADVGIRAPILPLSQQPFTRDSSGVLAGLGFVVWHRAASPVVSTARSLFLLSLWSAPSPRDTGPDFPASSPSFSTPLFLRGGCRRQQSGRCRQRLSDRSIHCGRQSVSPNSLCNTDNRVR